MEGKELYSTTSLVSVTLTLYAVITEYKCCIHVYASQSVDMVTLPDPELSKTESVLIR